MSHTFRIKPANPSAVLKIEKQASTELKQHFDLIKKGLEQIPNVPGEAVYGAVTLRALALKPDIFNSWFLAEFHSVKNGEIASRTKELLAAVISKINEEDECVACGPYHEAAAKLEGATDQEALLTSDYPSNRHLLSEKERVLIDFGIKAAFTPKKISDHDVQEIKDLGVSDAGIVELTAAALIAYNLSALNQVLNLKEGVEI